MNAVRLPDYFSYVADAPDAIERLRSLVLDLAIRGKLVSQDLNDDLAAELLPRSASAKKPINESRRAEVGDNEMGSYPFPIPLNWSWTLLGCVGDWGSGSTPPRSNPELYGGGITWLKSGELNDDVALAASSETVTEVAIRTGSFRLNRPGDVLVAMYGATIGKAAILATDAVTNQAVCGCTPIEIVLNKYLFIFLLSQRREFYAASEGGAQPNISRAKIIRTQFPLPPIAEQRRIVARVDELMAICNEIQAKRKQRETIRDRFTSATLARLKAQDREPGTFAGDARFAILSLDVLTTRADQIKQLRETIFSLAIRGKLVPQDPNDEPASELLKRIAVAYGQATKLKPGPVYDEPFVLPKGWLWRPLSELGVTQTGTTPPTDNPAFYGDFIPFIKPADLTGRFVNYTGSGLSELGLTRSRLTKKNSVLMVCIGSSIGKVNVTERDICCNQQINTITPYIAAGVPFTAIALRSEYFQKLIRLQAGEATLPIISKGKWQRLPVPVPPLSEQIRIVRLIESLSTVCDQLEHALIVRDEQQRYLLNALIGEALAASNASELIEV